jgi:nitroreductase
MNIPFSRWYSEIGVRRSSRLFDPNRAIESDKLETLNSMCKQFTPFPDARSCLVTKSVQGVFKGFIGSYGKVKGASAFIAFIGNMDSPNVQEEVGYTGEGIILEATALGLSTCWVGGFFRPEKVASLIKLGNNERVLAVTPVGYAQKFGSFEGKLMTGFGRLHKRLPISMLVSGSGTENLSGWAKESIESARLAPSAVNRQPWGFNNESDGITVFVRTSNPEINISKRLDCGIAMLHVEVAALNFGYKGEWQFLQPPQVAKFTIRQ